MTPKPNSHREIISYPYWGRDLTQDPVLIPGGLVSRMVQDVAVNQEPLRTDYTHNNINFSMRPSVKQDTSQMATAGDSPTWGVSNPGYLYSELLASVQDPAAKDPAARKGKT